MPLLRHGVHFGSRRLSPLRCGAQPRDDAKPVVVWQLVDGKRGHLNQSTGLINALGRRARLETHRVEIPPPWASLQTWLTGRRGWARQLPPPRVVIGAGHGTHLPMLAAGRACRAKTVVLMRPSLPLAWFDYCLAPRHDNPPARANVIPTRGAVTAMRPGRDHQPERGLVLVGGPSRRCDFDADLLFSCIRQVVAAAGCNRWIVAASPRTPAALAARLDELRSAAVVTAPWREQAPDWLAGELARAGDAWVSEDSISMIYEALTAGCRVGLLPAAGKTTGRLRRALEQLLQERLASSFADWQERGRLAAPAQPLDEAERCADLLLERGLLDAPQRP